MADGKRILLGSLLGSLLGCLLATSVHAGGTAYRQEDCDKLMAQQDINHCVEDNYEAADKALNALYLRTMAAAPGAEARQHLRESERAWIRERDRSCNDEAGPQEDGGSMWPMAMAGCLHRITVARIKTLSGWQF